MEIGWEDAPDAKASKGMESSVQSLSPLLDIMFSWMAFIQILGRGYSLHSIPAIVLDHVCQFNDVFAFFILLAALKGMFIFPAQSGFAVFTVDICNCM